MTDREKIADCIHDILDFVDWDNAYDVADHLLANGVVVREKGEWVKNWCDNNLIGHEYEDCPFCGCEILDTEKFWDAHFCPNCGADMRKGENG